ncbi:MAG: transposase [Reyranellaceae bacterium]
MVRRSGAGQTRKGNQWCYGMKAHVGIATESGLYHDMIDTAANGADVAQAQHGKEQFALGDAGYASVAKRSDGNLTIDWYVAMRPGMRNQLDNSRLSQLQGRPST